MGEELDLARSAERQKRQRIRDRLHLSRNVRGIGHGIPGHGHPSTLVVEVDGGAVRYSDGSALSVFVEWFSMNTVCPCMSACTSAMPLTERPGAIRQRIQLHVERFLDELAGRERTDGVPQHPRLHRVDHPMVHAIRPRTGIWQSS